MKQVDVDLLLARAQVFFAGIMLIGLIGFVIDQAFRLLHRKAFPWLHSRS